jgi:DNA-binding PadR family transcriptional regulator
LKQISSEAVHLQQGSLYPALHRLERRGRIKAKWSVTENGRRAKYYQLTAAGRDELKEETASWRRLASAVGQILDQC